MLTAIRILKLPKLLRLGRFFKLLEKFEGGGNVARIVLLMLIMTVFAPRRVRRDMQRARGNQGAWKWRAVVAQGWSGILEAVGQA